jgi:hypothetical protein
MNKHTFHLKREREEKHFIDEIKRRKKRVQMQGPIYILIGQ